MGLFSKKSDRLTPLFSEAEIEGASYYQVIDFLAAVNDKDYFKIIKVAETTRIHNAGIAKITGMKPESVPSIFKEQTIAPITQQQDTSAGDFLTDDELDAAFAEPAPKPSKPKAKKSRKNVKKS